MKILYEDNHIIAVDKAAGLLTQGDSTGRDSLFDNVREYLKSEYKKPGNAYLGMVQRLDRPVSGVVVFAKTSKAARRISSEFREHETVKIYAALVKDNDAIPAGRWIMLEEHILRKRGISEITQEENSRAKSAMMRTFKLKVKDSVALLMVSLLTGKKHQIRAQLSSRGMWILGDTLYGAVTKTGNAICLHSLYLYLRHPVTKEYVTFHAPLPAAFSRFMDIDPPLLARMEELAQEESTAKQRIKGT